MSWAASAFRASGWLKPKPENAESAENLRGVHGAENTDATKAGIRECLQVKWFDFTESVS